MMRSLSIATILVLAATSMAAARNGSSWHGRGHGNHGYSTGEATFFLEERKQAQSWYCGPGLLPTQPCVRR